MTIACHKGLLRTLPSWRLRLSPRLLTTFEIYLTVTTWTYCGRLSPSSRSWRALWSTFSVTSYRAWKVQSLFRLPYPYQHLTLLADQLGKSYQFPHPGVMVRFIVIVKFWKGWWWTKPSMVFGNHKHTESQPHTSDNTAEFWLVKFLPWSLLFSSASNLHCLVPLGTAFIKKMMSHLRNKSSFKMFTRFLRHITSGTSSRIIRWTKRLSDSDH